MKAKLFTDGGARGNPGPAAYGYVLEAEDGTVLAAHGERIGVATNNVAEYSALIAGLEKALELAGGASPTPACHQLSRQRFLPECAHEIAANVDPFGAEMTRHGIGTRRRMLDASVLSHAHDLL